jgi:PBSX family phage terminase large subunit
LLAPNVRNRKSKQIANSAFRAARDNPLHTPPYKPYGACQTLWDAPEKEVVISGPAGTGKSRGALQKIHWHLANYPGARALIIRKIRADASEAALYTYEEHVMGAENPIVAGIKREYRRKYTYPNGSEIVVGGMDKATRILSTEYDFIYIQEGIELTLDDYEKLITRARHGVTPYQQVITDTNPDIPTHWLKQRCDEGKARLIFSTHEDNPVLWDHEKQAWTEAGLRYLEILDALTGVRYQRYRWGKWVQAEGAVYDTFDTAIHVLDELPRDPDMYYRRFIGAQDWGYTNPGVFQVWGVDGDGRITLVHELYRTRQLIGWWTEQVSALCEQYGVDTVVCDPAEPGFIEEYTRAGIRAIPADNAIVAGIQRVQSRLKVQGDGLPRLYIYRLACDDKDRALLDAKQPTCLLDEIPAYVWAQGVDGKPNKEKPVDANNHGNDCMRYLCAYLAESEGRVLSFR